MTLAWQRKICLKIPQPRLLRIEGEVLIDNIAIMYLLSKISLLELAGIIVMVIGVLWAFKTLKKFSVQQA